MNGYIIKIAFILFFVNIQLSCQSSTTPYNEIISNKETIYSEIFQKDTKDWGYKILKNNKVYIIQENIPAIAGNKGFKTKEDAEKVADLVVQKIKSNEFPPSISSQELINLKIKL